MKPTYSYTPLRNSSREIRLLKLKGTRNYYSPLVATLTVHKIPSPDANGNIGTAQSARLPIYQALSYVWGSGPSLLRSHEIILDGMPLPITSNLHTGLQTYRAMTPSSMRYWVDAICINQADNDEKSAQIPLMRDIFHMAFFVSVWVGEQTPNRERVQDFLDKITKSRLTEYDILAKELVGYNADNLDGERPERHVRDIVRSESDRLFLKILTKSLLGFVKWMRIGIGVGSKLHYGPKRRGPYRPVVYGAENLKSWSPTEKQLKAVECIDFQEMATLIDNTMFFDTEYFNRMWTLQELVVADHGAVNILDHSITEIATVILYLQRTHNISAYGIEKITTLIDAISDFDHQIKPPIRSLLALSAGRTSENPRDRIYAIQGLMKDEMNPLLQPAYTKPVIEVYANTSRHIIFSEQSLDVLCGHTLGDRFLKLPSWVPDFRNFGLDRGALVDAKGTNTIYKASLSEKYPLPESPFQLTEEWKTLLVTGIPLGAISKLSDVLGFDKASPTEQFAQTEHLWAAMLRKSQEWKLEELEAIGRVSDLVAKYAEYYQDSDRTTFGTRNEGKLQALQAITEDSKSESESALDLQFKYLCTLLCGRIARGTRCNEKNLRLLMTHLCSPDKAGINALEDLCKALDTGTRGRRLIISEDKHMGAAPRETQKGDLIYVLIGCSVPVILRKSEGDGEFEFIGECYVHGFMDGEALATQDGGKTTTQEFKLV